MKKILIAVALVVGVVLVVLAADPRGRVDQRVLAGVRNFVQDEFERGAKPVFLVNGLLSFNVTNANEGIIFVETNLTALVHIGLPNPTNNPGRKFEVHTMDACTVVLTNMTHTGSFTSNNTGFGITHTGYWIQSNKTATAYSTGSNYIVRDF